MDKADIPTRIKVARDNYNLAKKIFRQTTIYNWVVVILYHSLLMYLQFLCECRGDAKQDINYPPNHNTERQVVRRYLKTANHYQSLLEVAMTFRYDARMIVKIQDKKYKHIIEMYFNQYKKCQKEICAQINALK